MNKRNIEGAYAKLIPEIERNHPDIFKNFFRMSVNEFNYLLEKITPIIKKQDTVMRKAISPGERLAITLRFLSSGDSYQSLMYLFRVPACTISTIIPEVCMALYSALKNEYLRIPDTEEQWQQVAKRFEEKCFFPNCLGALDGKHVVMKAPSHSGSVYYNYKRTHNIVSMALADANYKFLYNDVGINGRNSDGGVFNRCTLARALQNNSLKIPQPTVLPNSTIAAPYVIVADAAFAMKHYLMKPYGGRTLSGRQRVFNYRLSFARRIIENTFGILSARFRILRKPVQLDAEKTKKIVLATCALHNFILSKPESARLYANQSDFDRVDNDGRVLPGTWRADTEASQLQSYFPLEHSQQTLSSPNAEVVRQIFADYFLEEGELDWQNNYI